MIVVPSAAEQMQNLWTATSALRQLRDIEQAALDTLTIDQLDQVRTHLAAGAYSCQVGAVRVERLIERRINANQQPPATQDGPEPATTAGPHDR